MLMVTSPTSSRSLHNAFNIQEHECESVVTNLEHVCSDTHLKPLVLCLQSGVDSVCSNWNIHILATNDRSCHVP